MVLIQDGNQVFASQLNSKITFDGEEAELSTTDPTVIGATYLCHDSGKMYISSNGVDWDLYIQFTSV